MPKNTPVEIPYEILYDLRIVQEMPMHLIGRKFGVSEGCIRNKCSKLGIKKGREIPPRKVLFDIYRLEDRGVGFIAEKYGVATNTVKKWFKQYKIQLKKNVNKPKERDRRKEELKRLEPGHMSAEDIKIASARKKKDIVCPYCVGDQVEIEGNQGIVIQVTKELVILKHRFVESYRIADL